MGMRDAIQQVMMDLLRTKFPYLLRPPLLLGRVSDAVILDEALPLGRYAVRILTPGGADDPAFPEYPGIKAELDLKRGDKVILGLIRGEDAAILGRVNE